MSHTNITQINSTEINNSGPFRVGSQLTSGTAGQVLISQGNQVSPEWGEDTDTTYQGSATIDIDTTTTPDSINVLKVPHDLTFTGYDTGTFNGSSALSINLVDTDTTYTAGNGIQISGSNIIQTKTDNQTIRDSGGGSGNNLEVIKVPNDLTINGTIYNGSVARTITTTDTTYQGGTGISINTATTPDTINCQNIPNSALSNSTISGVSLGGTLANLTFYNSSGGFITSYNGATPPTSITLDGDTTYTAGTNIGIDGSNKISLDTTIISQNSIQFNIDGTSTTLAGSNYPSKPTLCSYLDLTSSTNIIPPSPSPFLMTKIQQTFISKAFAQTFTEFSTNFRSSFVAQSSSVVVSWSSVIFSYAKVFYAGLYDYNAGAWWGSPNETRQRFKYDNGIDQDYSTISWVLTGLTAGTTYYISPYFACNGSGNMYIYAGNNGTSTTLYANAIFRVVDGGDNITTI